MALPSVHVRQRQDKVQNKGTPVVKTENVDQPTDSRPARESTSVAICRCTELDAVKQSTFEKVLDAQQVS
jgi:hypothetical protein